MVLRRALLTGAFCLLGGLALGALDCGTAAAATSSPPGVLSPVLDRAGQRVGSVASGLGERLDRAVAPNQPGGTDLHANASGPVERGNAHADAGRARAEERPQPDRHGSDRHPSEPGRGESSAGETVADITGELGREVRPLVVATGSPGRAPSGLLDRVPTFPPDSLPDGVAGDVREPRPAGAVSALVTLAGLAKPVETLVGDRAEVMHTRPGTTSTTAQPDATVAEPRADAPNAESRERSGAAEQARGDVLVGGRTGNAWRSSTTSDEAPRVELGVEGSTQWAPSETTGRQPAPEAPGEGRTRVPSTGGGSSAGTFSGSASAASVPMSGADALGGSGLRSAVNAGAGLPRGHESGSPQVSPD